MGSESRSYVSRCWYIKLAVDELHIASAGFGSLASALRGDGQSIKCAGGKPREVDGVLVESWWYEVSCGEGEARRNENHEGTMGSG